MTPARAGHSRGAPHQRPAASRAALPLVLAGVLLGGGLMAPPPVAPLRAQGTLPTQLVQAGDITYQGSFGMPADVGDLMWANGALAFNPARNSLFVVGHDHYQQIGEISIPPLGGSATILQPFVSTEQARNQLSRDETKIGGLHVLGAQLVVSAYIYYDANGTATRSHFVRSTTLSQASPATVFRVGSLNPGFYAGYMADVPTAWRGAFGGDLLVGQCCIPIVSRTSFGPSVSVTSQASILSATNTAATMLLGYPEDHQTLGHWDTTYSATNRFNGTSHVGGMVVPEGTASILFIGGQGFGNFCYGTGPACGDPVYSDQGNHAYPYRSHVWAYSAHDLAAVKTGTKQPWEVMPYATWELSSRISERVAGVAFDRATGRLFVAEQQGDSGTMRIHVLAVNSVATR